MKNCLLMTITNTEYERVLQSDFVQFVSTMARLFAPLDIFRKMQQEESLKQQVLAASTADDVARIAFGLGFEFSGDELLRFSGQKVGRVTVSKQEHPGEYH